MRMRREMRNNIREKEEKYQVFYIPLRRKPDMQAGRG